jgi:hypothetical protein
MPMKKIKKIKGTTLRIELMGYRNFRRIKVISSSLNTFDVDGGGSCDDIENWLESSHKLSRS